MIHLLQHLWLSKRVLDLNISLHPEHFKIGAGEIFVDAGNFASLGDLVSFAAGEALAVFGEGSGLAFFPGVEENGIIGVVLPVAICLLAI